MNVPKLLESYGMIIIGFSLEIFAKNWHVICAKSALSIAKDHLFVKLVHC